MESKNEHNVDAGKTYSVAARVAQKYIKSKIQTIENYARAGSCYSRINITKALYFYREAFKIVIKNNDLIRVKEYSEEITKIFCNEGLDPQSVVEFYDDVSESYPMDSFIILYKYRVAEASYKEKNYKRALRLFEEIAINDSDMSVDNDLKITCFFKASLIAIVKNPTGAHDKNNGYGKTCKEFSQSAEYSFLNKILDSVESQNIDMFDNEVKNFIGVEPIDDFVKLLLDEIKKSLESQTKHAPTFT
ncbi:Beta-soluble NSF attachment protein [Thelohanellus kitauei]|uniref:Beta-soluble NSF attachment protein n=1 Tax=Thelohanellus kitauei TaxID=669202 RepID=A0A0C2MK52_THEKT|nr:Beta-soluble NSF attachment protein [Thelohanellus kitauei]